MALPPWEAAARFLPLRLTGCFLARVSLSLLLSLPSEATARLVPFFVGAFFLAGVLLLPLLLLLMLLLLLVVVTELLPLLLLLVLPPLLVSLLLSSDLGVYTLYDLCTTHTSYWRNAMSTMG